MKKLFFVLAIVIPGMAVAQKETKKFFFVQNQHYMGKSGHVTNMSAYTSAQFPSGVGIFNFSLVTNKGWGETVSGINFGRTVGGVYAEGGIGAGFETDAKPFRPAMYAIISGTGNRMIEKSTVYGWYEKGGSGDWYIAYLDIPVSKHWFVGVQSQKFNTTGLKIQGVFGNFLSSVCIGKSLEKGEPGRRESSATISARLSF